MAEEGFERKLAAILSANDGGCSQLIAENLGSTIRTITVHLTSLSFKLLNP